jgi:hypothetical protein
MYNELPRKSGLLLGSRHVRVEVVDFWFGLKAIFMRMAPGYHNSMAYQLYTHSMADPQGTR